MSDISKVKVSGTEYDIKDTTARAGIDTINANDFVSAFSYKLIANQINSETYNILQGACILPTGNIACAFTNASDTTYAKIAIINPSTFAVVNSAVLAVGHANSMCYYDGVLLICSADSNTAVYEVDATNLTLDYTYTLTTNPLNICYNSDTDKFVILHPNNVIGIYDTFFTQEDTITLSLEFKHGADQSDLEYHDGHYYIAYSAPTTLYIFDNTFSIVRVMDIPERYKYLTLMESENISWDPVNSVFWMGFNTKMSPWSAVYENVWIQCDFRTGNSDNDQQIIYNAYSPNALPSIYVDVSYTGFFSDGSSNYPFKEIQQALNNINVPNAEMEIYCTEGTYHHLYTVDKYYILRAQSGASIGNIVVNGVRCAGGCANVGAVDITDYSTWAYGVWAEYNAKIILNSTSAMTYTTYATTGGMVEYQAYMKASTIASGYIQANSRVGMYMNYSKNTGAAKIFGRAGLYNGTLTSSITLSEVSHNYVLLLGVFNIENNYVTGIINPTGTNIIPFMYLNSSSQYVVGFLKIVTSNSTAVTTSISAVTLSSSGGYSTYTISGSIGAQIQGVL